MTMIYQPRQIARPDGEPSGRWRVVGESDEGGIAFACCSCPDAHESPEAARACPEAAAYLAREFPRPLSREERGRRSFEAYNDAVGGVTWDGKPIPGWDAITPKIREAWCVAAAAARRD
jgi:hypothetical protein